MLEDNLKRVRENIINACVTSGRAEDSVELVGVTKTVSSELISRSIDLGIGHVGENRVQEFLAKYDMFEEKKVKKSIIGHLQRNKVKYIIDKVDLIQSLDSERLAEEISLRAKSIGKTVDCLAEINIGGEESKSGVSPERAQEFIEKAAEYENIRIKGIMAIPPIMTDVKTQIKYFEQLYKLFIDIKGKKSDNISMDILSMGMSSDYVEAIKCGANMVRVGTAIYGRR